MLSPFTAPGHKLFLSPRHASLSLGSASLKLLFYFLPGLLKLPSLYIYIIKHRKSSWKRRALTFGYGVLFRGWWVALLPELRPTTVLNPVPPHTSAGQGPRGQGSPQRPDALPAPPSAPPSPPPAAPLSRSPAQGWEALLSRTQAAERKAFGFGWEAKLQAQAESKATAEPAASPPFHSTPGKVQSPEMLPPPRWRLLPSLSPHDVRGREGGERGERGPRGAGKQRLPPKRCKK